MATIGPVGSTPLEFFYPISDTYETGGVDAGSSWYTLSDTEKMEQDDLIRSGALALVFPKLDFATFKDIALNFGTTFTIDRIDLKKLATMSMADLSRTLALAEQELVTKFLDRWVESEQKLAELAKQDQKRFDKIYFDALHRSAHAYMQKISMERQQPSAVPLAIILSAFTVDSSLVAEASSKIGNISSLSAFATAPPSVIQELSAVANGLLTMGIAWAAPVAVTLAATSGQTTTLDKDSAKAFALALATLVTNPELDGLISTRIDEAVQAGLIPPEKAQGMIAAFKASLLIQATGMLYRSEFGGITKEEIQQLIKGGTTLPENDFLNTLAKLVQEQLQLMDPTEAEKLVEECTAKYDQDLSSQGLLAPLVQFLSLWDPNIYQDTNLQS